MSDSLVTTIDLVRHGNVKTPGLFCAQPDEPLSEQGWAQLDALSSHANWDQVISSPHNRCLQFAQQFTDKHQIPLQIDARLRELDFGDWRGRTQQDIWDNHQAPLQQLWSSPLQFTAPGGESMQHFIKRVAVAWQQLLIDYRNQSILLLSHAGVIRIILTIALDIDYMSAQKFKIEHGKINRLCYYADNEYSLEGWSLNAETLGE